jgi:hypothetical protein
VIRSPALIHVKGVLLFLFIPLVLYLFLQHPFGVPASFAIAIAIMVGHRFVARPFFLQNSAARCFWCARTKNAREQIQVRSGESVAIELCKQHCLARARQFFDFTFRYRTLLRLGIFLPLIWYIVTMVLNDRSILSFPNDWNRFIFQFFIAATVVLISFAYKTGIETADPVFPFPIHNLSLIGAKNTLLVFRYVGFWWLAISLYFLWTHIFTASP